MVLEVSRTGTRAAESWDEWFDARLRSEHHQVIQKIPGGWWKERWEWAKKERRRRHGLKSGRLSPATRARLETLWVEKQLSLARLRLFKAMDPEKGADPLTIAHARVCVSFLSNRLDTLLLCERHIQATPSPRT